MAGIEAGSDEQSWLDMDHGLVFTTLTGDTIKATAKRLSLTVMDGTTICELTLEVHLDVYKHIYAGEWMGLLPVARGGDSELEFEEGRPIELRAVLRQGLLQLAMRNGTEVEDILKAMLQAHLTETAPLRMSESWLVTEAKQQIVLPDELEGSLKRGYRTLWAQPLASPSPSTSAIESNSPLNEIVERFLNGMKLEFERIDETILRLTFTGDNGSWIVLVRTEEEEQVCIVYSIYPDRVPEEHRTRMAIFLTEENYDLAIGSFEMDTADGELRYRTGIDVEHDRLTHALFGQLFTTNVAIMDEYFDVIADGMQ